MEIIIQPTAAEATEVAARIFAHQIHTQPASVLGLATGSTPVKLYERLVGMELDWSGLRTFNLDEYVGLAPEHPQSYHAFMEEHLFRAVNLPKGSRFLPDGMAGDVPGHCLAYEAAMREAGGIDLQLLGIGSDGHIGFNEPGSSLASRTRIKTLTARTRADNSRFFGAAEEVPFHVITMGIGTILESRHVLLLAFGEGKAEAVAGAVEGAITASNPASALQLHQRVTFCLDEGAASKLQRRDYYRWVYENKPSWQKI